MKSTLEPKWNNKLEYRLTVLFFLLIWTYLIIRAFSVFYIHDELVSKWSYIINWNPLPDQGYVDANNHFLLSFLGGLFTRLFHSDSMFVIRLASLLAFPIYFWSIYGLKSYFRQKVNFYGLVIGLTCTAFVVEYFALARGYGLSFAFLLLALQQTMSLFQKARIRTLIIVVIAWNLAVFANLTLIPFAIAGVISVMIFAWKFLTKRSVAIPLLGLLPIVYLVGYLFNLQDLGKLYYGGQEGFIGSTIHSITPYIWRTSHFLIDALVIALAAFIAGVLIYRGLKERKLFEPKSVFPLFFLLAIGSIFTQHWFFEINYPQDRTALYLLIFFIGALLFTLDRVTKSPWFSLIYLSITLVLFCTAANFNRSVFHVNEHTDVHLIHAIPDEVNGTPPSTGGRWNMEHELTRVNRYPMRMFQEVQAEGDTLLDYMIFTSDRWVEIEKWYHPIAHDEISGRSLFERKIFLNRTKINKAEIELYGKLEFLDLLDGEFNKPLLIRLSGQINEMDLNNDINIVFVSTDIISGDVTTYDAISVVQNVRIGNDNSCKFDFSYAMKTPSKLSVYAVYIWNKKLDHLSGKINVQVYALGD